MEKIKKYYPLKQVSHTSAKKMKEMQENAKDLEEGKMEKDTVSARDHGHIGNRWDGIQQYFREPDQEKETVDEKDVTDSDTAYSKEEEKLGETKENITKKERENIGNRWGGIQQYFRDPKEAENLEKYDTEDLDTIDDGRNKLDSKADVAKKENEVILSKWAGIKQYFTEKEEQRNVNPDESDPKDPNNLFSERDELIAKTSISERMRKNVGSKWITFQQYFREKSLNKKKNAEENGTRESNNAKFRDPEYGGHIVGIDNESRQNSHTAVEEEICAKKFKQLSSAHVSKSNTELKETTSLQSSNKIPIVESGVYSQNRINWKTDHTMGKELEGTWKVGCKLRSGCAKGDEFRWKVKLKLKPLRKFISIQLIQNSGIANSGKYKILDVPRKYKIVFVGDSGVGKTSFIRRYCNKTFKVSFHSTVGVDYREKEVAMDGKLAVLQLWDTAGQERYRSMCVQYYRNADAVVAIYDITAEQSFKNIRGWINNIQEVTDDSRILLLIGNKIDAVDFKLNNAVRTAHGALLAEEYGALFFETSVKYDESVNEAMIELVNRLLEKKIQLEKKLILEDKKNSEQKCC